MVEKGCTWRSPVSGLTMYKALDSGPASESGLMFMLVTKDRGAGSSRVGSNGGCVMEGGPS